MTTHTCPRRMTNTEPGVDTYDVRRAQPDGTPYPTTIINYGEPCCSRCGSLAPDRFMEMIEQGYEIGPTDKDYKVYVYRRRDGVEPFMGKFYFEHLSAAQRAAFAAAYNGGRMLVGHPGYFYVAPFFATQKLRQTT